MSDLQWFIVGFLTCAGLVASFKTLDTLAWRGLRGPNGRQLRKTLGAHDDAKTKGNPK